MLTLSSGKHLEDGGTTNAKGRKDVVFSCGVLVWYKMEQMQKIFLERKCKCEIHTYIRISSNYLF